MSKPDFEFEKAFRTNLCDMLMRQKPRPDAERVEYFLSECEREISEWLNWWPEKKKEPKCGDTDGLRRVSEAAQCLLHEVRKLSPGARQMLSIAFSGGHNHGVDVGKSHADFNLLEQQIIDLMNIAGNCHTNLDGQITKRPIQDIAFRITRAFVTSFQRRPPTNQGAIYPRVLQEISENGIPGRSFSVGRQVQEEVIGRAEFWSGVNK